MQVLEEIVVEGANVEVEVAEADEEIDLKTNASEEEVHPQCPCTQQISLSCNNRGTSQYNIIVTILMAKAGNKLTWEANNRCNISNNYHTVATPLIL